MKNLLIEKLIIAALIVSGLLFQGCGEKSSVTEPEPQTQQTELGDEEIQNAVADEIVKNAGQAVIMNDLAKIALYGSPEGVEEADDLIGLIQNDSTIVYEGETYSTVIIYDIKYKVGNRIIDEYSPLADTALIHYVIHSAFDNIQYHGEKNSESVEFKVSGIKMPTTDFRIDMLSEFVSYLEYELEPHVKLGATGNSFFNEVVVNIYTNQIESGTGGVEFDLKVNNQYVNTYFAEIEFLGNNVVKVTVNGRELTFTLDLDQYIP